MSRSLANWASNLHWSQLNVHVYMRFCLLACEPFPLLDESFISLEQGGALPLLCCQESVGNLPLILEPKSERTLEQGSANTAHGPNSAYSLFLCGLPGKNRFCIF